ncbi:hypothetical protein CLOM_g9975 [Closterium sp. NIES-68]|nr:hypothetical protein CLOM_g9975 [Closterium sp. NIES-68]GJP68422.1 hypothetical protein CLOP_g25135 [Closterium sp. NIES-67]
MSFESSQTWPASSTKVKKPQQAKKVKPPLVRDDEPIDVLYEDDWLLVVNKPAGVKHQPLHRFVGGALINRVAHYLQADPFTVHRLDMFTSGVICFAKSRSVSQTLHQAFRTKDQISKQYLVLVVGLPPSDSFSIDAPIARDPDHDFARMVVTHGHGEGSGEGMGEEQGERVDAPAVRDPNHGVTRMHVTEGHGTGRGERMGEEQGERADAPVARMVATEEQGEGRGERMGEEQGETRGEGMGEGGRDGRGEGVEEGGTKGRGEGGADGRGERVDEEGADGAGEIGSQKKKSKTQAARTEFRVLARSEGSGISLLQAVPITGRTHQIRVHLQHAKLPVLADHIYGALPLVWGEHCREHYSQQHEECSRPPEGHYSLREEQYSEDGARGSQHGYLKGSDSEWDVGKVLETYAVWRVGLGWSGEIEMVGVLHRQALHAHTLSFEHPVTGLSVTFRAPLPDDFVAAMDLCGLQWSDEP